MSQNKTLNILLDEVYHMALRKRLLNYFRDEKFAEIKRVRLGIRLPVYLPYIITEDLIIILRNFKEKALKAGIEQFIIQKPFQSPLEITSCSF